MMQPLRLLIVEDRAVDAALMVRELTRAGFTPEWRRVESEPCFLAALDDRLDIVLADYRLPSFDGLQALHLLREHRPDVPFIFVTGSLGEETAVDCIKCGASDLVVKSRLDRLGPAVTRTLEERRLRRAHAQAVQQVRATHDQLIKTESKYRALFENLLDGYLRGRMVRGEQALDAVCLEVNPAFGRLTGLNDMVGKRLLEVFPDAASEHPQLLGAFARAADGAPPCRFEFFFRPLAMFVDLTVYHSPPDEFIVIFDDVIERKHVEAALSENQARLQAALAGANIGLWEWNTTTNEVYFSPEWKRQLGYADDELAASFTAWEGRLHPDDKDRALATVQACLAEPARGYDVEFRLRHKDGSYRWIRARATLQTDAAGKPTRMVGCHLDITDDRQAAAKHEDLEAQLRQAQKLEAIGQLTGGVAHDFNNLLTAILGFARLLDESLAPADTRRKDLREIQSAADRAARLTRQLLAFSRRQVLEPAVVNVNTLVSDLTQLLGRLIGEHIALETRLESDLGATRVDPGQIEQVITNLVVNARDAMPSGGTLTLETANIALDRTTADAHVPAVPAGCYVCIRVSDTGTGIEESVLKRIFEPFFTTKPLGQGTGLGLSTAYGIVQQSGGYIDVQTSVGRGTTFGVYLPSVAAEPQAQAERSIAVSDRGSETILLVEDEAAIRRLTQRMLEQRGYRVLLADGPAAALKVSDSCTAPIDLLVTDVVMPGGTGPELYRALACGRPGLPVLFMSGYPGDAATCGGLGRKVFLQKPFEAARLAEKVREAIDSSQRPPP